MRIVSFKGNPTIIHNAWVIRPVLCNIDNNTVKQIIFINDSNVIGRHVFSVKLPDECYFTLIGIAKKFKLSQSEVMRRIWLWTNTNKKVLKISGNLKEKICAGLVLYNEEEIIHAPILPVQKLPMIHISDGECHTILVKLRYKYNIRVDDIKRKVLWLMS
jgi:hypothetical protein